MSIELNGRVSCEPENDLFGRFIILERQGNNLHIKKTTAITATHLHPLCCFTQQFPIESGFLVALYATDDHRMSPIPKLYVTRGSYYQDVIRAAMVPLRKKNHRWGAKQCAQ